MYYQNKCVKLDNYREDNHDLRFSDYHQLLLFCSLVNRGQRKETDLARLPRGDERPGGGRPEAAGSPPLLLLWVEPAEREGEEARSCARDEDIDGRVELKSCCGRGLL